MIDIKTALANILKARYGRDVRQSIHDAIFQMDQNANEAVEVAITSQESAKAHAEEAKLQAGLASEEADRAEAQAETAKTEADRAKSEADKAAAIVDIGPATNEKIGLVKPDGTSITVDEDGTIHSKGGGSADVSVDNETISQAEDGTISVMKEALDVIIEDITKAEYERRIAAGEITEDDIKYYNIVDDEGGSGAELKPATKETLGGVIVGDGINVDEYGVISALGLPIKLPQLDTSWTTAYSAFTQKSGGYFKVGNIVYVSIGVKINSNMSANNGWILTHDLPKSANYEQGFSSQSLNCIAYYSGSSNTYFKNVVANFYSSNDLIICNDTGETIPSRADFFVNGFYYCAD